jgi:hypothetical protein
VEDRPIEPLFENAWFNWDRTFPPTESASAKTAMLQRQISARINIFRVDFRAFSLPVPHTSLCAHATFHGHFGPRRLSLHLWGFGRNVHPTVTVQGGSEELFSDGKWRKQGRNERGEMVNIHSSTGSSHLMLRVDGSHF